ncbi:MAG: ABC transporter permease [Dissulfurispiraceae bacterium]|jgi:tungstate transport system permease protein|nr:ABC transporter permease [Dissulfurispiraceae bacterium]
MDYIFFGFTHAVQLILQLDSELLGIIFLSLKVSGAALFMSAVIGIPSGAFLSLKKFPMRSAVVSLLNTFMGLPPVVVGLFLYLLLSRSGPLGFMSLLYTPYAMTIAQTVLSLPIVMSLTYAAVSSVNPIIRMSARSLGADNFQTAVTIIKEARMGIMAAVIAAFGRVIAEVGAILIVGGNIAGLTRVMTTAIAMETDKGNFELALALGIILLSLSLIINAVLHIVQKTKEVRIEMEGN